MTQHKKTAAGPSLSFILAASALVLAVASTPAQAAPSAAKTPPSTWPQKYSVTQDGHAGALRLETPYYVIEHDLRHGGVISRVTLRHGRAANLLVSPLVARVRLESGETLSDLGAPAPKVEHRSEGLNEIVSVESPLVDASGRDSGLRVRSTFEYRWGYVRIHREFLWPQGSLRLREVCPVATVLSPGLSDFGYRQGITEDEGAEPFAFGSDIWGKLGPGLSPNPPLVTRHVPRSMIFVDPGIEGLEWFVSSNLAQWETKLAGRRGMGRCALGPSAAPAGTALSISPLWAAQGATAVASGCAFDFYLAVPLLEGHAHRPWIHRTFDRNRGDWYSTEEIRRWAEQGYQSVHCHNDGDAYDDGLFWHDGSYPPYPDMDRYDKVLTDCRQTGIRTATYFSNKELHPSTPEYKQHGEEWGRKDRAGHLRHNTYRNDEFGAQMCLRSDWLGYLEFSIDRVLKNHPLDGVYFDWNAALFCCNPLHEGKRAGEKADGHWDIDELLSLMEWTRKRIGPEGLLIIHNSTVPMFATENFADRVVATEWGYQKWTDRATPLADLPTEWSLAGARTRGVISYGVLDEKAPRVLHRLFALEAFLGGVTQWTSSPETLALLPLFKPLGDIESFRFTDWRNEAVKLSDGLCHAAVYSRPGEAYVLVANLDRAEREVACSLDPGKLAFPLAHLDNAAVVLESPGEAGGVREPAAGALDAAGLVRSGVTLKIPGAGAVLIRLRGR